MVIELAVIFLLPLLMLWLQRRIPFLRTVGAVSLCYLCGFIIALLPLDYDKGLSQTVASVIVAVAIPLILMSLDLTKVRTLVRDFLVGYGLQIVAVIAVAAVACFIAVRSGLAYAPQLSGMAVGLYTGGTPNLIAIGMALIPSADAANVISAANTADFLSGGIYFLLFLTVLKPVYRVFLGRSRSCLKPESSPSLSASSADGPSGPVGSHGPAGATCTAGACKGDPEYSLSEVVAEKRGVLKLVGAFFLAVAVLALGAGIEILVNGNLDGSLFLMVTVSVVGIALSFVRPIREIRGSYQLGQYLVLVFAVGLSMSIDLGVLIATAIPTVVFFATVQLATILVHMLLCRIFRVSAGAALITSVAGIYGPPFVSPVATSWGDRELIAPGIVCGVVGLAIGNLLGIAFGMSLAALV